VTITETVRAAGTPAATPRDFGRRLVIILSLLLVLTAAASALVLLQGIDRRLSDVVHTYEVRMSARELTLGLIDAETGQRGYLLTGDQRYLDPYRRALGVIDDRVGTLLQLTEGNAGQRGRIVAITDQIDAKLAELAHSVALTTSNQEARAGAVVGSNASLTLMDDLRQALSVFIAEEDRQLIERSAQFQSSRQWMTTAVLAALAGAAMLAYALFARTQREVSSLTEAQSALLSQRDLLEAHVRARTAEAEEAREHAESERRRVEALLQDTNHRIGNSLATVSSLLGLQVNQTNNAEVRTALEAARSRVHAIASGHRRLRLGADLETARADEFLEAVVDDLKLTQPVGGRVRFVTEVEPIVVPARDATTIGILVGELITNALKHAFPEERAGEVTVSLKRDEAGRPVLSVSDNGVGMTTSATPGGGGLGSMIVRQLSQQFGGIPSYDPRPGGGVVVTIVMAGLSQGTSQAPQS
jgi:two-component sensor histidine kinase/CHASE3 domain sensor protein